MIKIIAEIGINHNGSLEIAKKLDAIYGPFGNIIAALSLLVIPFPANCLEILYTNNFNSPYNNFELVSELATPVVWPMLIGSLPTMILVWIVAYFSLNFLIKRFQSKK